MNPADIGLAVAETAACVAFACAGSRLWRSGDAPASMACWLAACAALGLGAYSAAVCAGLPN